MSAMNDCSDDEWGNWGKNVPPVIAESADDKPVQENSWINNDDRKTNGFCDSDEDKSNRFDKTHNQKNNFERKSFDENGGGFKRGGRFNDDGENKGRYNRFDRDNDDNDQKKRFNRNNDDDRRTGNRWNDRRGDDDRSNNRSNYRDRRDNDDDRQNNRSNFRDRRDNDDDRQNNRSNFRDRRDNDDDRQNNRSNFKDRRDNDDDRQNSRSNFRDRRDNDDKDGSRPKWNNDDDDQSRSKWNNNRDDSRFNKSDRDNDRGNRFQRSNDHEGDKFNRGSNDNERWNSNKRNDDDNDRRKQRSRDDNWDKSDNQNEDGGWKSNRNDSESNNFRSQGRSGGDEDLSDRFSKNINLDKKDTLKSKTFFGGGKEATTDNQNDDSAVPKRATYVPNDDEEDYFLHVNSGINFDNYEKIPVEVTGDDVPPSITKFSDLELPDFLSKNIEELKYAKLTPVQKYAIPIISHHRDLMGCAQTGSGKTFAFLLPMIVALEKDETTMEQTQSKTCFPKVLILAPTRELCRQIFTVARQLTKGSRIKCAYIYGGIEMNKSRRNLQDDGCDILVATPGRLIHFLQLVWISLRYLKYFVLDEADRMLESDGFYESVKKVYEEANFTGDDRTIQISMFSATFPTEIQTLARDLLKNYLFLAVGVVGSANSDVKQEIIQVEPKEKLNTALDYIKTIPDQKTLIFVESKRMADFLGIKLGYLGYTATTIHGDRDQQQREMALNDFKSGRVLFMVATNVAARGLDIPKVDVVINVDMPQDIDTYVHRIGRTGRCGNVGRAVSFFDDTKDIGLASGLINRLEEASQDVPDFLRSYSDCVGVGLRRGHSFARDTRNDMKVTRFVEKRGADDDDFMKGTNVDYDETPSKSEWFDD